MRLVARCDHDIEVGILVPDPDWGYLDAFEIQRLIEGCSLPGPESPDQRQRREFWLNEGFLTFRSQILGELSAHLNVAVRQSYVPDGLLEAHEGVSK